MYQRCVIRNVRALRDLDLGDLPRFVLLSGRNDTGKTTALEALFLHAAGGQPQQVITIEALRGAERAKIDSSAGADSPWLGLFRDFKPGNEVTVQATVDGRETTMRMRLVRAEVSLLPSGAETLATEAATPLTSQVLELDIDDAQGSPRTFRLVITDAGLRVLPAPAPPLVNGVFHNASWRLNQTDVERYSDLLIKDDNEWMLEVLQIIDRRIAGLVVATYAGQPWIWAKVGLPRLVPIHLLGMGAGRLFGILTSIGWCSNGVVFIDEIENGLHYSALPGIWAGLARAARTRNVQVFATTHSRECISAAHLAFIGHSEYDFKFIRLDRDESGAINAKGYDREALDVALATGLEVR